MKKIISTIKERWKAQIPIFFQWMIGIGTGVAGIASAIQMALTSGGATIPEWWEALYPYLIGISAGIIATAKFTQKH